MAEQWKPVAGFESAYEVSDLGRIRSLPRTRTLRSYDAVKHALVERQVGVRCTPKLLKQKLNNHGYFEVCLRAGTRQRMAYVQRLVCEAFHGPPPDASAHAAHLNGYRQDNRLVNLSWTTPVVNASQKPKFRNVNMARDKWRRALRPEKERAATILRAAGMDDAAIARCLDLSKKTLAAI